MLQCTLGLMGETAPVGTRLVAWLRLRGGKGWPRPRGNTRPDSSTAYPVSTRNCMQVHSPVWCSARMLPSLC
eukprot:2004566-Rhodomonas_salina.7